MNRSLFLMIVSSALALVLIFQVVEEFKQRGKVDNFVCAAFTFVADTKDNELKEPRLVLYQARLALRTNGLETNFIDQTTWNSFGVHLVARANYGGKLFVLSGGNPYADRDVMTLRVVHQTVYQTTTPCQPGLHLQGYETVKALFAARWKINELPVPTMEAQAAAFRAQRKEPGRPTTVW
ncbi:MAG: hypothetical protein EON54_03600 [Alcaligenaceae bacterium]|nr:MAG: hypothetical protein EON54_03600 [Alcaligenaceae bacterium]